jgi:hypothetical protein
MDLSIFPPLAGDFFFFFSEVGLAVCCCVSHRQRYEKWEKGELLESLILDETFL